MDPDTTPAYGHLTPRETELLVAALRADFHDDAADLIEELRHLLDHLYVVLTNMDVEMFGGAMWPAVDAIRDADADLANRWEAVVVSVRGELPEREDDE